jgi:GNAT superfamily N-acetyltransferase
MRLDWLDPTDPDPRHLAGAAAVLEAARVIDCPHESPMTVTGLTARLRHGWDGHPAATAVATDTDGRISGVLGVDLPRWDNTHLGTVDVTVDPVARQRGLGRAMYEAGLARIVENGRRLVVSHSFDLPATVAFAKALGLNRVGEDAKRRLDVIDMDLGRLNPLHEEAVRRSAGYELVRIAGTTPDHLLADVAKMTEAINDAPIDGFDVEDEVYTPDRVSGFEHAQLAHQRRIYRLLARERATGALAGHTMIGVQSLRPGYGDQYDTSVLRSHRGHRLGLLLKIAMLKWLAEVEPQLRVLDTWNAVSNAHMVAVNDILGYRVVAYSIGWQRHL